MAENYWRLDGLSILTVPYAYVDSCPLLAYNLFQRKQLRLRIKKAYGAEGLAYAIVICRVLKRDTGRFEEAMKELQNKMLLLGHRDYDQVCTDINRLFTEEVNKSSKN